MTYALASLSFTPEQFRALTVSPDELSRLPPEIRAMLYLKRLELDAHRRSAFWSAVGAIATAAALLGVVKGR